MASVLRAHILHLAVEEMKVLMLLFGFKISKLYKNKSHLISKNASETDYVSHDRRSEVTARENLL